MKNLALVPITADSLGLVGAGYGSTIINRKNYGTATGELMLFIEAFSPSNAKTVPLLEPFVTKCCFSLDDDRVLGNHLSVSWINLNLSVDTTKGVHQWVKTMAREMHLRYLQKLEVRKHDALSATDDVTLLPGHKVDLVMPNGGLDSEDGAQKKKHRSAAAKYVTKAINAAATSTGESGASPSKKADSNQGPPRTEDDFAEVKHVYTTKNETRVIVLWRKSGYEERYNVSELCRPLSQMPFLSSRAAARMWVTWYPNVYRAYFGQFIEAQDVEQLQKMANVSKQTELASPMKRGLSASATLQEVRL